MEENKQKIEKNDLDIKPAGIDKDNLVLMREEDFKESVSTDKGFRRFILNACAEMLSIITEVQKDIELTNDVLTMAFSKELAEYYKEQTSAIKEQQNKEKARQIIEKSHQKSKKVKK